MTPTRLSYLAGNRQMVMLTDTPADQEFKLMGICWLMQLNPRLGVLGD